MSPGGCASAGHVRAVLELDPREANSVLVKL